MRCTPSGVKQPHCHQALAALNWLTDSPPGEVLADGVVSPATATVPEALAVQWSPPTHVSRIKRVRYAERRQCPTPIGCRSAGSASDPGALSHVPSALPMSFCVQCPFPVALFISAVACLAFRRELPRRVYAGKPISRRTPHPPADPRSPTRASSAPRSNDLGGDNRGRPDGVPGSPAGRQERVGRVPEQGASATLDGVQCAVPGVPHARGINPAVA